MNITDIESVNKALKFRQFIRANKSGHPIGRIQRLCLEELGYSGNIKQEYSKTTKMIILCYVCENAVRLLLVKCYDIKIMVKSPGCSSVGAYTCG